jgi:hypothetical protein
MADRTLRRTYIGTIPNPVIDDGADGSIADIIEDGAGTSDTVNNSTVGDGEDTERDTERLGSGVRIVEIDPEQLGEYIARDGAGTGDGSDNGDGTRKRRKRGPNKRTTGAKKAQETVKPFLLMAHTWAAVFLKTPELNLTEDEADKLSNAYNNFCEYHDIPILSPKRMSEINMILALGMVYGPRVVAVRNRIKEEAKVKKARNVTPIAAVN